MSDSEMQPALELLEQLTLERGPAQRAGAEGRSLDSLLAAAADARQQTLAAAMAARGYVGYDADRLELGKTPIAHAFSHYQYLGDPPLEVVLPLVARRHEVYTRLAAVDFEGRGWGAAEPQLLLGCVGLFHSFVMDGAPALDVLMPRFMRMCELSRVFGEPGMFEGSFLEWVCRSRCMSTPLGRAFVEEGGGEAAMAAAVASLREALASSGSEEMASESEGDA